MKQQQPTIYVIHEVTYDYHRFQRTLGASTDIIDARDQANKFRNDHLSINLVVVGDNKAVDDDDETPHIWVETIEPAPVQAETPEDCDCHICREHVNGHEVWGISHGNETAHVCRRCLCLSQVDRDSMYAHARIHGLLNSNPPINLHL